MEHCVCNTLKACRYLLRSPVLSPIFRALPVQSKCGEIRKLLYMTDKGVRERE